MKLTASRLRQDIYRILDRVLATGQPVEIERKGRKLRIVPEEPSVKLSRLESHDYLRNDPETYVHLDWSEEWRP